MSRMAESRFGRTKRMKKSRGAAAALSQPASLSLLLEPVPFDRHQKSFAMGAAAINSTALSHSAEEQEITAGDAALPIEVDSDNGGNDAARTQFATAAASSEELPGMAPQKSTTNSHLSNDTATEDIAYSTGNTPLNEADHPVESIELDADIIMRELAGMGNNDQPRALNLPIQFDNGNRITGLKPESEDPFLFQNYPAIEGQTPISSSPSGLNLTQGLPATTCGSPFDPSLNSADLISHHDEGQPPFNMDASSWNLDDFMGTPVALPPAESPNSHPAMRHQHHPHVFKLLDEHGRRRSQSMPPPGVFTFRRRMEDGNLVNISKATAPQDPALPLSQYLASGPAPASIAHGFRYHPYERTGNRRSSGARGVSALRSGPAPRSYPTTPGSISPSNRPVSLTECSPERMSLDEYHNPAADHYRPSPTSGRDDKRRGRGTSKKALPPPNWSSPHRQELEALATPIVLQLEAVKTLVLQRFDSLTANPPNELEAERARQRTQNRQVTHLNQHLTLLAGHMHPAHWAEVPRTGLQIRDMSQRDVATLLDRYGIPYVSTMFLHEKKAAYLRFLGCNRGFMHRVLDWPE